MSPRRSPETRKVFRPAPTGTLLFRRLSQRARNLEWFLFALVGTIAVMPSIVFAFIEFHHLKERLRSHTHHSAVITEKHVRGGKVDFDALTQSLRNQMAGDSVSFLAIADQEGRDLVRLGDSGLSRVAATERLRLPSSAAPLAEIRLVADGRSLGQDITRVALIHLLVGFTLALAFYRIGAKPLNQAVREIEATQAQLLHSDRLSAIGEMYAGLTHEINNPLGIMLARVNLVLTSAREGGLDRGLIADLESIEKHGARIAAILRSLLAFARKTDFRTERTDLNRIVREVVGLVERPFAKQAIHVEATLADDLPHLQASPAHLQQVFLNLFNNARDAMPDGGRLTVRTSCRNGTVIAEVRDQGKGLAPQAKERLFQPFFTTKDIGKGTGLGLSVSYGIVKAHGGDIEAESPPEGGALFRLKFAAGG